MNNQNYVIDSFIDSYRDMLYTTTEGITQEDFDSATNSVWFKEIISELGVNQEILAQMYSSLFDDDREGLLKTLWAIIKDSQISQDINFYVDNYLNWADKNRWEALVATGLVGAATAAAGTAVIAGTVAAIGAITPTMLGVGAIGLLGYLVGFKLIPILVGQDGLIMSTVNTVTDFVTSVVDGFVSVNDIPFDILLKYFESEQQTEAKLYNKVYNYDAPEHLWAYNLIVEGVKGFLISPIFMTDKAIEAEYPYEERIIDNVTYYDISDTLKVFNIINSIPAGENIKLLDGKVYCKYKPKATYPIKCTDVSLEIVRSSNLYYENIENITLKTPFHSAYAISEYYLSSVLIDGAKSPYVNIEETDKGIVVSNLVFDPMIERKAIVLNKPIKSKMIVTIKDQFGKVQEPDVIDIDVQLPYDKIYVQGKLGATNTSYEELMKALQGNDDYVSHETTEVAEKMFSATLLFDYPTYDAIEDIEEYYKTHPKNPDWVYTYPVTTFESSREAVTFGRRVPIGYQAAKDDKLLVYANNGEIVTASEEEMANTKLESHSNMIRRSLFGDLSPLNVINNTELDLVWNGISKLILMNTGKSIDVAVKANMNITTEFSKRDLDSSPRVTDITVLDQRFKEPKVYVKNVPHTTVLKSLKFDYVRGYIHDITGKTFFITQDEANISGEHIHYAQKTRFETTIEDIDYDVKPDYLGGRIRFYIKLKEWYNPDVSESLCYIYTNDDSSEQYFKYKIKPQNIVEGKMLQILDKKYEIKKNKYSDEDLFYVNINNMVIYFIDDVEDVEYKTLIIPMYLREITTTERVITKLITTKTYTIPGYNVYVCDLRQAFDKYELKLLLNEFYTNTMEFIDGTNKYDDDFSGIWLFDTAHIYDKTTTYSIGDGKGIIDDGFDLIYGKLTEVKEFHPDTGALALHSKMNKDGNNQFIVGSNDRGERLESGTYKNLLTNSFYDTMDKLLIKEGLSINEYGDAASNTTSTTSQFSESFKSAFDIYETLDRGCQLNVLEGFLDSTKRFEVAEISTPNNKPIKYYDAKENAVKQEYIDVREWIPRVDLGREYKVVGELPEENVESNEVSGEQSVLSQSAIKAIEEKVTSENTFTGLVQYNTYASTQDKIESELYYADIIERSKLVSVEIKPEFLPSELIKEAIDKLDYSVYKKLILAHAKNICQRIDESDKTTMSYDIFLKDKIHNVKPEEPPYDGTQNRTSVILDHASTTKLEDIIKRVINDKEEIYLETFE